ncbi:hypothetical protein PUN28_016718 [Cardiocondyla obscurior]|uniref:Myb/SANT-like DNA-binding domain-containing protein n=1 Tax=Cardiocondyla obscurior TaxID=286306 RepID=A0AAW2EU96_9HYME
MKRAYQEIAKSLMENNFNVSPLQVENRFKTLKRAYKNMMLYNRRNGRGKYICSYEQVTLVAKNNSVCSNMETPTTKTVQHNSRLEAQNVKIIENLQSCQRLLRNLITRMDSKNKNANYMQNGVLQVCMEMRDLQKEAYSRAEEQREKANAQRETRNSLLEEIVTLLKSEKNT